MKKKQYSILNALVILALAVSLAACGSKPAAKPETPGSNMPDVGIGGAAEKTETVEPDHTAEQSNLQRKTALEELAVYMASVKEQSAALEEKLQQAVSQADLTMAAGERYKLWDQALSHLLEEIEKLLPEEYETLQKEQTEWIAEREKAAAEAGKAYEHGSMYPMVVSMKAAAVTEERVARLYEKLSVPQAS